MSKAQLERQIMTIQIELESLKKEKDRVSIDRREKLEQTLKQKRNEMEELNKIWAEEKYIGLRAF
jgi:ATP-dependent Clp protease ATP-binding subunit ClpB